MREKSGFKLILERSFDFVITGLESYLNIDNNQLRITLLKYLKDVLGFFVYFELSQYRIIAYLSTYF